MIPPVDIPAPERVLIVKPSALGDVVTALPILRGLRRTFPEVRIDWLVSTTCAPLIAHDTDLNECVLFDRRRLGRSWRSPSAARALLRLAKRLRAGRYDWTLDAQGLLRSGLFARITGAKVRAGFADAREGAGLFYTHPVVAEGEQHTVDRNIALARRLGVDARPEDMTLQVSAPAREFADRFVREKGLSDGFLICVPPTRWVTKLYPVRHWRTVTRSVIAKLPVVLLGAPGDQDLCAQVSDGLGPRVISAAGQTDVAQMVALIAGSRGVVCCDSAAKFIAPAVGVDVVTLLGPTRAARTGPYLRGKALIADIPCQGCLQRTCPHITCMQLIDPADVTSAVDGMLAAGRE
jgi:lipopolysaccharide heptosyltransferase I